MTAAKVDKPPFRQDACNSAIRDTCELFNKLGLSMVERWWVCLCIEYSAEAIMADGFQEVADELRKIKDGATKAEGY